MTTLYHNPRCSKSRQALQLLQEKGETVDVVLYLKNVPSIAEIKNLLSLLNITAEALVRKGELIWKENYKGKEISEEEIIKAMNKNPKLIERPIAIKGTNAVIGRPPEKVLEL
ncbi:arsenate reductase [Patiriisocius marinistellae]|uniref:Arsenate reductase n=1 Tax=Patiriisocius marinistellae TaxID=2494560 RepID=A0A5J4FVM9_9FLAO|nr:arsenate reductase (glutaredoxin) [Patiriisocius marinistellae]GEQ86060.1 arsenate reductase [Patiriisocius marinistellae]